MNSSERAVARFLSLPCHTPQGLIGQFLVKFCLQPGSSALPDFPTQGTSVNIFGSSAKVLLLVKHQHPGRVCQGSENKFKNKSANETWSVLPRQCFLLRVR